MENSHTQRVLSGEYEPEAVDTFGRFRQIEDRTKRENQDRKLRQLYGKVILGLLISQLLFIAAVVFLLGFGIITLDRWVATTVVSSTLAEVSGMAYLVVRYLFPLIPDAAE